MRPSKIKKLIIASFLLLVTVAGPVNIQAVTAGGNEYDAVCDYLEDRYGAEKVKVPFMWLARMAVGIVRPAGVKAFKVTIYKDLKFSPDSLDGEMRSVMKEAFSDDWTPILRVRSKNGEQVYMNMREYKHNVKVLLVSINRNEAVVVRARFNPDKLAEFIDDPKIFGISLDGREDNQLKESEDEIASPEPVSSN